MRKVKARCCQPRALDITLGAKKSNLWCVGFIHDYSFMICFLKMLK